MSESVSEKVKRVSADQLPSRAFTLFTNCDRIIALNQVMYVSLLCK